MDQIVDQIETREIVCQGGMPGYLCSPAGCGKAAVVIVMHERYGYVKHPRDVAERFAREGFIALAPNMFYRDADQAAINRGDKHYDMTDPESVEHMGHALETLRHEVPRADMSKVAVMGVCQTGRHVLVTAAELPVAAGLIWYGGASAKNFRTGPLYPRPLEELIEEIKCPIHAVYGEACHTQPVADVREFRNCLERHRKSFKIIVSRDAPHGFLNDTMPGRYRRAQAEAGWASQAQFLRQVFAPDYDRSRLIQIYESDISVNYDFSKNRRLE
jgi:carboxymethylenebutenolidase